MPKELRPVISPKRSRRNGNPTMERSPSRLSPEVRDKDDDRKHRRRLQDPLPLEKSHASDSKLILLSKNERVDPSVAFYSFILYCIMRLLAFYGWKHNDRSNAGQDGTSTGRGGRSDRGWWRSHEDDRRGRHRTSDAVDKGEKPVGRGDDTQVLSRDEPSKINNDQPTKKKFREEKPPPTEKASTEPVKKEDGPPGVVDRREERGNRGYVYAGRNEYHDQANNRNRLPPNRARPERGGFPSRDRFRGEGYVRRQGYGGVGPGGSGGRVDKWKHDMFDEVNRSPKSKNEEDPVAKVEALLAL
ncbi:hypothetical protein V2J09_008625 [Rumex salicifolius]